MRRIPAGKPGAGIAVVRVHYSADPAMTAERVALLRQKYTSDARWRREMEIEYEALEGERLYPEYSPERNECQPFDVSDPWRWTIWMACDPHMRTPHGFLWEAFSANGIDRVVCGELWPPEQYTVREYAEAVRWLESDADDKPLGWDWAQGKKLRICRRIMDTHGSAANSDEGVDYFGAYRGHELTFQPAKKGEGALGKARDSIGEALLAGKVIQGEAVRQVPRLRVFRGCAELRGEFENVRYPSGDVERAGQERPETYRKHLLDCLHYIETANAGFVLPELDRQAIEEKPIYPAVGY